MGEQGGEVDLAVVASIRVVWMVAISCWLKVLRTMSRPGASEA
jgi:hypothetical protein